MKKMLKILTSGYTLSLVLLVVAAVSYLEGGLSFTVAISIILAISNAVTAYTEKK